MFTKALFSTTALAAAASAYMPNLQARQTDIGFSEECQSAIMGLMPIFSEAPTPPPVVVTATATDPCATPDLSGSELSQYESYMSAASEWAVSNSAALESALQECPEATQYATSVPVCSGAAAQPTGSSSDDSTSTGSDDNSSNTGTDEPSNTEEGNATETPGAASRETGMMAAAVLVAAGVLGFLL